MPTSTEILNLYYDSARRMAEQHPAYIREMASVRIAAGGNRVHYDGGIPSGFESNATLVDALNTQAALQRGELDDLSLDSREYEGQVIAPSFTETTQMPAYYLNFLNILKGGTNDVSRFYRTDTSIELESRILFIMAWDAALGRFPHFGKPKLSTLIPKPLQPASGPRSTSYPSVEVPRAYRRAKPPQIAEVKPTLTPEMFVRAWAAKVASDYEDTFDKFQDLLSEIYHAENMEQVRRMIDQMELNDDTMGPDLGVGAAFHAVDASEEMYTLVGSMFHPEKNPGDTKIAQAFSAKFGKRIEGSHISALRHAVEEVRSGNTKKMDGLHSAVDAFAKQASLHPASTKLTRTLLEGVANSQHQSAQQTFLTRALTTGHAFSVENKI